MESFKLDDYIASINYNEPITWNSEYIHELYEILLLSVKYKAEPDAFILLLNDRLKTKIRYRLTVTDRIQMQYKFNSLMGILNFTMANLFSAEGAPLKICKHYHKAFISQIKRAEFCSERYRNQFNIYKSRAKRNKLKQY